MYFRTCFGDSEEILSDLHLVELRGEWGEPAPGAGAAAASLAAPARPQSSPARQPVLGHAGGTHALCLVVGEQVGVGRAGVNGGSSFRQLQVDRRGRRLQR